jgi:hypothetical protein
MAKKMSNVFQLIKGAFQVVQSAIYTIKIDLADGTTKEFGKADLVNKDKPVLDSGANNYRFKMVVPIPVMQPVTDIASLQEQIGMLAAAIDQYDGAENIVTTDGREIPRRVRIAVNSKGEAVNVAGYLAECLIGAITLNVQKQMQKPLRDEAESVLRDEYALEKPATKARVKATQSGVPYNPENELS